MKGTISFWLVVVSLAAWPLALVALFTLSRRFPSGVPHHQRWMFWAAPAPVYLAGSVYFLIDGEHGRGFSFVVVAIGAAAYALDQRSVSKNVEA